jgi:DNA-binding CsgD family transcriptional regulator
MPGDPALGGAPYVLIESPVIDELLPQDLRPLCSAGQAGPNGARKVSAALAAARIGTTLRRPLAASPIRGREREVHALEGQLRVLSEGRGSITVLEGSPGTGKSRLIAEAGSIAKRLGVRVGGGGARRSDRVVVMGALLDSLVGGSEPLFARDTFRDIESVPDLRYWVVQEIEAMLEIAARKTAILVAIDDLQWADGGTISAFEMLAVRLAGLPIAWLVAWRPAEIPPEASETLGRLEAAGALRLSLAPLDADAVAEVVGDLAGAEPDDSLLRLAASADGIPFWLTELLIGLREEGLLVTRNGRAATAASRLPARMSDNMQQRLERMSALARRVASVGAALGRTFPFDVMRDMVGAPAASLLEPVDELIRADILVDHGDQLSFRHDILREAVLDSMPTSARTALERDAVSALLAAGLPPTEVADQLAASARPGDSEAIDVLFAAAKALGVSDPAAAADLAMKALQLTPPGDSRRGPLVAEVAILLHAAGRLDEATSFARTALKDLLPPEQESEVLFSIAGMFSLSADMRADAGRRALALRGLTPQDRARHQARLVHNVLAGGRRTEAQRLVAEVSEEIAAVGDEASVFSLELAIGGLRYEEGRFAESLEKIEQAVRAGSVEGEDARGRIARQWRTEVLATVDRFDEAVALAIEGLESAQRDSQAWAVHLWEQWRGRQHYQLGEYSDAIATLDGILRPEEADSTFGANDASAISALSATAIRIGDRHRTRACGELAVVMVERGTPELRRHAGWVLTQIAVAEGDQERALHMLRTVAATLPDSEPLLPYFPVDVIDQVGLVRLAVAAGDPALGREAVELAAGRASKSPSVDTVVGAALHAQGLLEDDRELLARAVELLASAPRRTPLASALEDHGVALLATGDKESALEYFDQALELANDTGAMWDATRVRRRLRAMGVRRRLSQAERRPQRGWDALSPSEIAVVRAITSGMTNREAAAHLFLSPHTVSTHLRHAFEKLEINSRVELARIAATHDAQAR